MISHSSRTISLSFLVRAEVIEKLRAVLFSISAQAGVLHLRKDAVPPQT